VSLLAAVKLREVLIVEDDLDIRETIAQILQDEGYRVRVAGNGREALERLREGAPPPSVILLDLMMPIMSGWQFRKEQEIDPKLSGIPVVVLTADGRIQEKARSIAASAYLQKPIDLESLLDTVERFCAAE
jgi:CheY-like chemotaxis protein